MTKKDIRVYNFNLFIDLFYYIMIVVNVDKVLDYSYTSPFTHTRWAITIKQHRRYLLRDKTYLDKYYDKDSVFITKKVVYNKEILKKL